MGNVSSDSLQRSNIVPLDGGKRVCAQLEYKVQRGSGPSIESLLVCPVTGPGAYEIIGHGLLNPTTGQTIHAGLLVQWSS